MEVIQKLQNKTEEDDNIMEAFDMEEDLPATEIEGVDGQSESEEPNHTAERAVKQKEVDPNHSIEHKPRRTNKRRKTNVEKEESIAQENLDDGATEACTTTTKKKKTKGGARRGRPRGGSKAKSKKAVDEGDDSPSSPLHLLSDSTNVSTWEVSSGSCVVS